MMSSRLGLLLLLLYPFGGTAEALAQGSSLERALEELWRAENLSDRGKAANAIGRLKPDYDLLVGRLRLGPRYSKDARKGLIEESRKGLNGLRQEYAFLVPETYDPEKRYRVAFYLHGGVNRREPWEKGEGWWKRFDRPLGSGQISVFPSSWRGSLWWQSSQIENLEAILLRIKRDYNLDENRVYLFGVSDGGTGAYYHATKAPTAWAAFFPFLGHPGVLENPATGVDGELFVENLKNRAFFVVNGEKDELYPISRVKPYLDTFEKVGVEVVFHPHPGGHNTRWWNGEQEAIDQFVESHPRNPLPDRLTWETERTDRFARIHWLVIEELAEGAASGKVELHREENRIEVTTRGVARYRLLLSPDQFDLRQPIEVVTNGVVSHRAVVEPSAETLLRWSARDSDRTMLFGAELPVLIDAGRETPAR
jgi:predicted esterase